MDKILQARWAVAALFMANGFIMGSFAPQIPLFLPRHDIAKPTMGLMLLALGLGAVAAMLFAGRLIAHHGLRRTLTVFSLAIIPVLPAVVLSPSIPVLVVTMAAMGAVIGCMDVVMNAQAVEVERGLGRAIMSSSHGFWSLGGFAASGLGGVVIAGYGAVPHAIAAAALAGIVIVAALRFIPAAAPRPATETAPRIHLLPRDKAIWLLGMISLLSMVPEGAVLDWGALYLRSELGADIAASGLAFSLFAGAMALMRFLGDGLRNRYGAVRTLRISALIGATGLMAAAMAPTATVAILAFGLAGIGVANMIPVIFSAAGNHPGMGSGAAISFVTMVGYAGILVGPTTIGFVAEAVGFRVTFGVLACVLLVVAVNAMRAGAAERTQPDPAA